MATRDGLSVPPNGGLWSTSPSNSGTALLFGADGGNGSGLVSIYKNTGFISGAYQTPVNGTNQAVGFVATSNSGGITATFDGTFKPIYALHTTGSMTLLLTGQYTAATGTIFLYYSENKLFEQIIASATSTRLTRYGLAGTTLTEEATQTITTVDSLSPLKWLSTGYATAVELDPGTTATDTSKVLWIYSGGSFNSVTSGWPSEGHRASTAIPLSTGVVFVSILVDNGGSDDSLRAILYSGGAFQTVSTGVGVGVAGLSTYSLNDKTFYDPIRADVIHFQNDAANGIVWNVANPPTRQSETTTIDVAPREWLPVAQVWIADGWCYGGEFAAGLSSVWGFTDFDSWEQGQFVVLGYRQIREGTTPPGDPETVDLWVYDDNATGASNIIWSTGFNPPDQSDYSQNWNFWFTSDGTSGGTPLHGTLKLRMRVIDSNIGGYTGDTFNDTANEIPGILRVGARPSSVDIATDAGHTTHPNPFAWPDTAHLRFNFTNATKVNAPNETLTFKLIQAGSTKKTVTGITGTNVFNSTTPIDDQFDTGNVAADFQIEVQGNASGIADKWTHFLRPTGSEYTWTDKFTIKYPSNINVDKRIYYATTGSPTVGTSDMKIKAYHPTGTTFATLFNVEESVTGYTYLINSRSELLTGAAPFTGTVFDSGNTSRLTAVWSHSGAGVYTGSFLLPTGTSGQRIAEHVGTGQPFYVKFQPAGTNAPTATGLTSWNRSSWWKVDSHPQISGTLVKDDMTNNALNENKDYIISADLLYWWGHVQNARGEDLSTDVELQYTAISHQNNESLFTKKKVDASGWSLNFVTDDNHAYNTVNPTSPAGNWKLLLLAHKSGTNVSGTSPTNNYAKYYDSPNWGFARETTTGGSFSAAYPADGTPQTVNFISAFRDNITIEPSWGVSGQTGKVWTSGDTILLGFRVHKNGSGYAVDSGTTPRIKIGRLKQTDGTVEYWVGSEAIGATMTHVESIFGAGADDFTWVYFWDTSSGVPYSNYVAQFNPSIDGAISYEHVLMKLNSGYLLQSTFDTYTGGIVEAFNPADFSLYGVMKTYLNPDDDILAETHNHIQGIGRRDVAFAYSGKYVTGFTIDNDSVTNSGTVTWGTSGNGSGKPTQIVEAINHKLSGSTKTVTTDLLYNSSGRVTGTNTNVS